MNIQQLKGRCVSYELVGSRVTCDPAPTDTDQDVLVLGSPETWPALEFLLGLGGFEKGGSNVGDQFSFLGTVPNSFQSYTLGDLNLIITFDPEFYRRFMAATWVCKLLNLMAKPDRVALFQAVLYGNAPPLPLISIATVGPGAATPPPPPPLYVSAFWVSGDAATGCIEAIGETGARAAYFELYGAEPLNVEALPYPAEPRLNSVDRPGYGVFPSFCHSPRACKGRGSCPQRYSCTE